MRIFRVNIRLEDFVVTEFNEIFSSRQKRQEMKFIQRFGNYLNTRLHVVMGANLFPEASEKHHVLTSLTFRENSIELHLSLLNRISKVFWNSAVSL